MSNVGNVGAVDNGSILLAQAPAPKGKASPAPASSTTREDLNAQIVALKGNITPGLKWPSSGKGKAIIKGRAEITLDIVQLYIAEGSKDSLEKAVTECDKLINPASGKGTRITYFRNVATILRAEALLALKGEGKTLNGTTINELIDACDKAVSWLLSPKPVAGVKDSKGEVDEYVQKGLDLYQAFNGSVTITRLMREKVGGYVELERRYDQIIGLQLTTMTDPITGAVVPALKDGKELYPVKKDDNPSSGDDLTEFRIGLNYLKIRAKMEKASLLSSSQDPATILVALDLIEQAIGTQPAQSKAMKLGNEDTVVPDVKDENYGLVTEQWDIENQSKGFFNYYTAKLKEKFQLMPLKSFQYYQARLLRAKLNLTYASLTGNATVVGGQKAEKHEELALTEYTALQGITLEIGGYPHFVSSAAKAGRINVALSFDVFETLYSADGKTKEPKRKAISKAIAELEAIVDTKSPRFAPNEYEYVDATLLINKLLLMRNVDRDPYVVIANADRVLSVIKTWNNKETRLDVTARTNALKAPALIATTRDSEVRKHANIPIEQANAAVKAARKAADDFRTENETSLKGLTDAMKRKYGKKMDDSWETEYVVSKAGVPDQRKWVNKGIHDEDMDRYDYFTALPKESMELYVTTVELAKIKAEADTADTAFGTDCGEAENLFAAVVNSCKITNLPEPNSAIAAPDAYRQYDRYVRQWAAAINILIIRMAQEDLRPQNDPINTTLKHLEAMENPEDYLKGITIPVKVKNEKGQEVTVQVKLADLPTSTTKSEQKTYIETLLKLVKLRAITRQIFCVMNQYEVVNNKGYAQISFADKTKRIVALYKRAREIELSISKMDPQPLIEGELLNMYEEMVNATLVMSNFDIDASTENLGDYFRKIVYKNGKDGDLRDNLDLSFDVANALSIYPLREQRMDLANILIDNGYTNIIKRTTAILGELDATRDAILIERSKRIIALANERIGDLKYWLAGPGIGGGPNIPALTDVSGAGYYGSDENAAYNLLINMKGLEVALGVETSSLVDHLGNIRNFRIHEPAITDVTTGKSPDIDDRGYKDLEAQVMALSSLGNRYFVLLGGAIQRNAQGNFMVPQTELRIGNASSTVVLEPTDNARKGIVTELLTKARTEFDKAIRKYNDFALKLTEQERRKMSLSLGDIYKKLANAIFTAAAYAPMDQRATLIDEGFTAIKDGIKAADKVHDPLSVRSLMVLKAEATFWYRQVLFGDDGALKLFDDIMSRYSEKNKKSDEKKTYVNGWDVTTPGEYMINYASTLFAAGYWSLKTDPKKLVEYWGQAKQLIIAVILRNLPAEQAALSEFDINVDSLFDERASLIGRKLKDSPMYLGRARGDQGEMALGDPNPPKVDAYGNLTALEAGRKKLLEQGIMCLCDGIDIIRGARAGKSLERQVAAINGGAYTDSNIMRYLGRLIEGNVRFITQGWFIEKKDQDEPRKEFGVPGFDEADFRKMIASVDQARMLVVMYLQSMGLWKDYYNIEDINKVIDGGTIKVTVNGRVTDEKVPGLKARDKQLARALRQVHRWRALLLHVAEAHWKNLTAGSTFDWQRDYVDDNEEELYK